MSYYDIIEIFHDLEKPRNIVLIKKFI